MKIKFSLKFFEKKKNSQTSNFMTIRPVGAELSHANGRSHMTKVIVAFCNFVKAPRKCGILKSSHGIMEYELSFKIGQFFKIFKSPLLRGTHSTDVLACNFFIFLRRKVGSKSFAFRCAKQKIVAIFRA